MNVASIYAECRNVIGARTARNRAGPWMRWSTSPSSTARAWCASCTATWHATRRSRRQQRGVVYGAEVQEALRVIAESTDHICAERLTPNLVWLAQQLDRHGELAASPELLAQLAAISVSTVGRVLARQQQDQPRLPRQGVQQAHRLRDIPMLRLPWQEPEPGHCEVDLVHHGGASAAGEYVYTLQLIDVATGWSERVAVLGRGHLVMEDAFRRILARLPFPVRQIHPDNGGEFFSQHVLRFWQNLVQGVRLSRSRPYHKNDNPRVEQTKYPSGAGLSGRRAVGYGGSDRGPEPPL